MRELKLRRVIVITIAWVCVGGLAAVYDHLSWLVFKDDPEGYSFASSLVGSVAGGFFGGVIGGTTIVFYLKGSAAQHSFSRAVALHALLSSATIVVVALIVTLGFQSAAMSSPPIDPDVLGATVQVILSPGLLKVFFFWFTVVGLTSLLLEVSDKYGPGVLRNFVLGRYHDPKVEDRCFMFLDMRSSTGMAERLGHSEYFALLRSCFADMTTPIIDTGGEIYQYVGDEVVVTWPVGNGAMTDNAVHCFHEVRAALQRHRAKYEERFGVLPEFKAGLHAGRVSVGEVGTVRKDIVFSGDVLNTASRIQERCNELGHDLLLSAAVVDRLTERQRERAVPVGHIALRGRQEPVTIFALAASADS